MSKTLVLAKIKVIHWLPSQAFSHCQCWSWLSGMSSTHPHTYAGRWVVWCSSWHYSI